MRGDSIIARFDTTARRGITTAQGAVSRDTATRTPLPGRDTTAPRMAARDTTAASELRELFAEGNAQSYYQLAPEDTSEIRPSVNFVTGRRIIVSFRAGEVRAVRVTGQTYGVLLQPARSAPAGTPDQPAGTPPPASAPPATVSPPPGGRK